MRSVITAPETYGKVTGLQHGVAVLVLSLTIGSGIVISAFGALLWARQVQTRDDWLAEL